MAVFSDFPPEIVLLIVSLQTRVTIVDPHRCLMGEHTSRGPELVPDLSSINSLSQTNIASHRTVNQTLYELCASVEALAKLAVLFAVQNQLESTLDKFIAAKVTLGTELDFRPEGSSLLHIAATLGFGPMVVKLLGMYAEEMVYKPTTRYSHLTALGCAARHGHIEVVHLLAPTSTTSQESSHRDYLGGALIEAAQEGHTEISEYLISVGADVNFQNTGSAIWYATNSNQLASVQLLLASGADPNLGRPLFTAASYGHFDIVQALVEGGADINFRDTAGRNVLPHTTSIELLLFFLEHGADPNNADYEGTTVLHAACEQHDEYGTAFVQLLCKFGAVPDKTNDERRTAVDLALTNGTPEVVKILEPYVQTPALQAKIARWWESRETIEV